MATFIRNDRNEDISNLCNGPLKSIKKYMTVLLTKYDGIHNIGGRTKLSNMAIEHRRSVQSAGLYVGYLRTNEYFSY